MGRFRHSLIFYAAKMSMVCVLPWVGIGRWRWGREALCLTRSDDAKLYQQRRHAPTVPPFGFNLSAGALAFRLWQSLYGLNQVRTTNRRLSIFPLND